MENKDLVVLITGILVFVSALANIAVAVWRENRRSPVESKATEEHGALDRASAIETLQDIVDKQAEEDKKLRIKIEDLQRRLGEVEHRRVGPFLLEMEFLTSPEPVVTRAKLTLLPGTGPLQNDKDR